MTDRMREPVANSVREERTALVDTLVSALTNKRYQSWGRYPKVKETLVQRICWGDEIPNLNRFSQKVLAFGYGRSYGDVCLNNEGVLLDTSTLNHFLSFDKTAGLIRVEAGVSLADILNVIVPYGWFLPVTPGTKFVSVGGAIANDVHGKNHHAAGTFGCHVTQFALLRSDGTTSICSPSETPDLFRATIGGLGLTGMIVWAEVQLKKIANPYITTEQIKFSSLDEFWEISPESDKKYEYTVSWLDCLSGGNRTGRGHLIRGNHSTVEEARKLHHTSKERRKLRVPIDIPSFLLNAPTMRAFNVAIYNSQRSMTQKRVQYYDPFFYPLDSVLDWNRAYGKKGFLQYQCVIPTGEEKEGIRAILKQISDSGEGSFLAVFKVFGQVVSPGILSFPRPGATLALDFPFHGRKTLEFLDKLDKTVRHYGGVLYPAKDARMSKDDFQTFFPDWNTFARSIDPCFSSSFWRRVTGGNTQ